MFHFRDRPSNSIYIDRLDTVRLKSNTMQITDDIALAIATLKHYALFPTKIPVLSQSQVFDGFLPILSKVGGKENAKEFNAIIDLLKRGNMTISLFNKESLVDALSENVKKGIDPHKSDYCKLFEFSGLSFLQDGTNNDRINRRKLFLECFKKRDGNTGDFTANTVIERVWMLDEALTNSAGYSKYVKAQSATKNLLTHINDFFEINKVNPNESVVMFRKIFEDAQNEGEANNRSYYYKYNLPELTTLIDGLYNLVLDESNTGYWESPVTNRAENLPETNLTVLDDYINRMTKHRWETKFDTIINGGELDELKWADILEWELMLDEHPDKKKQLRQNMDYPSYIEDKTDFLIKNCRKSFFKKLKWIRYGVELVVAVGIPCLTNDYLVQQDLSVPLKIAAVAFTDGLATIPLLMDISQEYHAEVKPILKHYRKGSRAFL